MLMMMAGRIMQARGTQLPTHVKKLPITSMKSAGKLNRIKIYRFFCNCTFQPPESSIKYLSKIIKRGKASYVDSRLFRS